MSSDIQIKKARFLFSMNNENDAFEFNESWDTSFKNIVFSVLEKVLERFNNADETITIESLNVPLGNIAKDDLYIRYPLLLEEKLEEAMVILLNKHDSSVQIESKKQSFFSALSYYLIHGHFPWTYKQQLSLPELFLAVMHAKTLELCQFLKTYGAKQKVRQRMILQLHDTVLLETIKSLQSAEHTFIEEYIASLNSKQYQHQLEQTSPREHRNACWEVVLSYVLVSKAGHFSKKEFVRQTIRQLASHYNTEFILLLSQLTATLGSMQASNNYYSSLRIILEELSRETPSALFVNKISEHKEVQIIEDILLQKSLSVQNKNSLISMFRDPKFREICLSYFTHAQFNDLLNILYAEVEKTSNRAEALKIILELEKLFVPSEGRKISETDQNKHETISKDEYFKRIAVLLKRPLSRRTIIRKMHNDELETLLHYVFPHDEVFVRQYSQMLDEQHDRNNFEGKTSGEFKLLKWEFIFTVLLESSDSAFNRKHFVRGVFAMLAAHYNTTVLELLKYVYNSLIANLIEVHANIAEIIKDLYFTEKENTQTKAQQSVLDKLLQNEQFYELLKTFMQTGIVSNEQYERKMFDIFMYLEKYCPQHLVQIACDLKKGLLYSDICIVPKHALLYCRYLQFVLSAGRMSFPEVQMLKNYLVNTDEALLMAMPVETLKQLLWSVLTYNRNLFGEAWQNLMDNTLSSVQNIATMPSDIVCYIFENIQNSNAQKIIVAHKKAILHHISRNAHLLERIALLSQSDRQVVASMKVLVAGCSISSLFDNLKAAYSISYIELEAIQLLFAEMKTKMTQPAIETLLAEFILRLGLIQENPLQVFAQLIRKQSKSIQKAILIALSYIENACEKSLQTSAMQELRILLGTKKYSSDAEEKESDYSAFQLLEQYAGMRSSYDLDKAFREQGGAVRNMMTLISQCLRNNAEQLKQYIAKGTLSREKVLHILYHAPDSTKLQWMQTMAKPYHAIAIQEALLLFEWLQDAVAKYSEISFNRNKALQILLDFCSGYLQNRTKDELLGILLKQAVYCMSAEHMKMLELFIADKAQHSGKLHGLSHYFTTQNKTSAQNLVETLPVNKTPLQSSKTNDETNPVLEEIFIENAGLVLCGPYLPRLFSLFGFLENGAFRSYELQARAVLLLQYMLHESTYFPEHMLVLNKLLCGLQTGIPLDCEIEVTSFEKDTMNQMLMGMMQHWKKMSNTTVQGFKGSFLVRTGKLENTDETWNLTIEERGYDVLLDSIPWSYSPINFAWMAKPLMVKWR